MVSNKFSGINFYVNRAGKNFPVFIPYGKKLTERSENAKVRSPVSSFDSVQRRCEKQYGEMVKTL
jgi:hypothetical protein